MTYRQMQLALKQYRLEGKTAIKLNSKKELLCAEIHRIEQKWTCKFRTIKTSMKLSSIVKHHCRYYAPNKNGLITASNENLAKEYHYMKAAILAIRCHNTFVDDLKNNQRYLLSQFGSLENLEKMRLVLEERGILQEVENNYSIIQCGINT